MDAIRTASSAPAQAATSAYPPPAAPSSPEISRAILEVNGVDFCYTRFKALRGIDLKASTVNYRRFETSADNIRRLRNSTR